MLSIKYINLVKIVPVVLEIWGEIGNFMVPVNNSHTKTKNNFEVCKNNLLVLQFLLNFAHASTEGISTNIWSNSKQV